MDGLIGVIVAAAMGMSLSSPAKVDVVGERSSELVEYAGGTGDSRASAWRLCDAERTCRYGVVVTGDGFATRTVLDLPQREYPRLFEAGDAFVALVGRDGYIADTVGGMRPFAIEPARPVGDGETIVVTGDRVVAVDARSATAHLVPVPSGIRFVWRDEGELRGLGLRDYAWSSDGARTWDTTRLPLRHQLWSAETEVPGVALMSGGDGATVLPFGALHRYDPSSDTWTSTPGPTDPGAYSVSLAELADGRMLMTVPLWSDARRGKVRTPPGIWVDGEHVEPGPPFDEGVFWPHVLDLRRTATGARLLVEAAGQGWVSRDLGRSWRRVALR